MESTTNSSCAIIAATRLLRFLSLIVPLIWLTIGIIGISHANVGAPGQTMTYTAGYEYYVDDVRASVTYPVTGRVVTTCADALGRAVWVSAVKGKADCEAGAGPTGFRVEQLERLIKPEGQ
ncbi:MAG TPA: hypothetical protein DEH78_30630 [Solibacterales bacterium]|nr:hypothetical protein [Bryobacterales bacterium]